MPDRVGSGEAKPDEAAHRQRFYMQRNPAAFFAAFSHNMILRFSTPVDWMSVHERVTR
jgi:hypothetical protein